MTTTMIDGVYWLLGTDPRAGDFISRYNEAEFDEVFTAKQRLALRSGLSIIDGNGVTWTNMVDAARSARRLIPARAR